MTRADIIAAYFIAAARVANAPGTAAARILERLEHLGFRPTLEQLRRGSDARRHAARLLHRRRLEAMRKW